MTDGHRLAPRPFSLMAKPVGDRCNLACAYCFYRDHTATPEQPAARLMDERTLRTYVRSYLEVNPGPEIDFVWQGGEPTLAGMAFFQRVLALQAEFARGRIVRNAIQTNGLLIDDAWADFLARHGFLVGLSLDGPPELTDAGRGPGVAARVRQAFERLTRAGVACNLLAVVNAVTAPQPLAVYRYLTQDLGATFLQLIPVVERAAGAGSAELAPWSVSGAAYGAFITAIFDQWLARDVGRVFVQLFDNALTAWAGGTPGLCVMRPTCGTALVVDFNGDVYSCDHFVQPDHRLGNLRRDPLATLVAGRQQRAFGARKAELPHPCHQCRWRFACQGGCPRHRVSQPAGPPLNHLCDGYRAIFAHFDPHLRLMVDLLRRGRAPAEIMRLRSPGAAADAAQDSGAGSSAVSAAASHSTPALRT